MISKYKLKKKGHNAIKQVGNVSYSLHIVQSWSTFVPSVMKFQSYGVDTISILIITTGHNSVNLLHGVTVFILCISSDHGLQLCQVSRKYLEWFQCNGVDKISILINTKGHNSVKNYTQSYNTCSLQIV